MINFYNGRPGNGKSLHMAEEIYNHLRNGKNVIANFEINESMVKPNGNKKMGIFFYVTNLELQTNIEGYKDYKKSRKIRYSYIEALKNFAIMFHERDLQGNIKEHQTVIVIDECQEIYNSRDWHSPDRLQWCSFYRHHRKYGYDVYLISQDDKSIDKQIRAILEYEFVHRKVNNFGKLGKVMGFLMGGDLFVYVQKWYGVKGKDNKVAKKFFKGKKKFYYLYNTSKIFDD